MEIDKIVLKSVKRRKRMNPVRARYDRFAPRYDEIFGERQTEKILRIGEFLGATLPLPALDVGAGTGLAGRVLGHQFINLDFSEPMLSQAPAPRVLARFNALPFVDDYFQMVLSVSALIENPNPSACISELVRVLVRGGTLALSVLKNEDHTALESILRTYPLELQARLDLVADLAYICRKR